MKLPVQELKIDRSFIAGIVANPDLSTIVRSTIELGHNLGMTVVPKCGRRQRLGPSGSPGIDDAQDIS